MNVITAKEGLTIVFTMCMKKDTFRNKIIILYCLHKPKISLIGFIAHDE